MSEFIFIAPEGWTTITAEQLNAAYLDINTVTSLVAVTNYGDLASMLRDGGVIASDQGVTEARVFDGQMLVARLHTL